MFLDIMPARSHQGGGLFVYHAPLAAGQVFVQGDLVAVDPAGSVIGYPQDGTEALIADNATTGDALGVACWGPGQAGTAELPRTRVMINPITGNAFATGDLIGYWPANSSVSGTLWKAQVLAAGGAAAGVGLATHRNELFQLAFSVGTTPDLGWGVELTAGVPGTDICARVVEVLAVDGRPTGTAGTHFLFEIITALPAALS